MKSKLILTTWLHLALAGILAVQVVFLWMCLTYVVPIYQQFRYQGWLEGDENSRSVMAWAHSTILNAVQVLQHFSTYFWVWAAVLLVGGVVFARWMRGENKMFIGLSTLATAALGLMLFVCAFSAVLAVPLVAAIPNMHRSKPESIVKQRLAAIDLSCNALSRAFNQRDWDTMEHTARLAIHGVDDLATMGAAAPAIVSLDQQQKVDELRSDLKTAQDALREIEAAIQSKDVPRLQIALAKFRDKYSPIND